MDQDDVLSLLQGFRALSAINQGKFIKEITHGNDARCTSCNRFTSSANMMGPLCDGCCVYCEECDDYFDKRTHVHAEESE